jgi:DNA polymerase-3 subunit alpha
MISDLSAHFTHLEVHPHYTLLGGTSSAADLAAHAATDGMSALALTDTNALYGVVAFAKACRAAGVQPIVGMAVTVTREPDLPPITTDAPGRLVLLATGPAGYRSLCRLSSLIQGSPERDTLARRGLGWADLEAHHEGLICLSGGRMGWLERLLRAGDEAAARAYTVHLADIYGESVYLSLEVHRAEDQAIAQAITEIGRRVGLPCAAVQPVYCLNRAEAPRLKLLAAIDCNCPLEAVPAASLPALGDPQADLHWLNPAEVAERFAAFPEALAAVGKIVARCGPALPDGRPIWPALKLPAGQSPDEALAELAHQGAGERYGSQPAPEVGQRLEMELAAIAQHGYAPLFLIVADVVRFARQAAVPVSTRGSVANSLVAYCTGITTVDPLAHSLLFERFLNPARADPPDIDLDFCSRRRDRVLDYVRSTYGAEHVALVGTVSTMLPRSAVRETAKAYGLDEAQIGKLVAHLPRGWHPDPRRREERSVDETVAELGDARLGDILRLAYGLVGQPHHLSVHPGAVVITPGPLTDLAPVQWAPKGFLITQLDHRDVAALGLPKIDLLGISALTVLADAAELVRANREPAFRVEDIPLDDPPTGNMLARGDTIGVFQFESDGSRQTLRKLQARTVRDLAVANAFFKPGPAMGGMATHFIRRYRGQEPVTFLHPALAPILGPTQGILLYQEEILRIAREIAGLSWAQADHLRRGMSRFRAEEMAQMRQEFVDGCQRPAPDGPGFSQPQAETLWEQVMAFAGYGFNQGHATAYADVSYRLAYLKAHWPAEFLAARLATGGGFHPPAVYMAEAVRLGIPVRPPHVNHSRSAFTLESETRTLWMGLGQVRDLRRASIHAIVAGHRERPFGGLRDLLARVTLLSKEVTHLIQCGALDGLGESRAALLAEVAELDRSGGPQQLALPFDRAVVPPESPAQRLAWEQTVLGQPVSVHPLKVIADRLPEHVRLAQIPSLAGRSMAVAGVRLPGWTGGQGFYLGDGETFVIAKGGQSLKAPSAWQPMVLRGRWLSDEFSTGWFQVDEIKPIQSGG